MRHCRADIGVTKSNFDTKSAQTFLNCLSIFVNIARIGHFVQLHARLGVGRGQQRGLGHHLAVVLHRVKSAGAGEGFDAAPFLREVVGQRLAAAFEVADGVEEFHRIGVFAKHDGIDHAAQVRATQVLVLFFDHHGTRELLEQVRQGDELAWEAFLRQFQARVFGLAYHYLGNREEARDLAQEVFIRVYQHLATLPEPEGLSAWLLQITRNGAIDQLRRRKARPALWDVPVEELFGLSSPEPNPEEQHLDSLRKERVHQALRELTGLNREIILLKEIQGLALEDIARLLEVPLGTVKSRSHRARLELAQHLTALDASQAVAV